MKYEQFLADVVQSLAEVDFMGRMLSRVKSVLSATHDLVEKNGRLEKENAELRDELDDWKGNAEGFQPDAYMRLPVDADGVPIRLKDWVWYVGIDAEITKDDPQQVVGLVSDLGMNGIYAVTRDYPDKAISPKMLTHRASEPADSWEKLEEDAKQRICSYFGIDQENASCEDCPYGSSQTGRLCWRNASLDMIARAKKLAGIEGEAQR